MQVTKTETRQWRFPPIYDYGLVFHSYAIRGPWSRNVREYPYGAYQKSATKTRVMFRKCHRVTAKQYHLQHNIIITSQDNYNTVNSTVPGQ